MGAPEFVKRKVWDPKTMSVVEELVPTGVKVEVPKAADKAPTKDPDEAPAKAPDEKPKSRRPRLPGRKKN